MAVGPLLFGLRRGRVNRETDWDAFERSRKRFLQRQDRQSRERAAQGISVSIDCVARIRPGEVALEWAVVVPEAGVRRGVTRCAVDATRVTHQRVFGWALDLEPSTGDRPWLPVPGAAVAAAAAPAVTLAFDRISPSEDDESWLVAWTVVTGAWGVPSLEGAPEPIEVSGVSEWSAPPLAPQ